jgi:transposase
MRDKALPITRCGDQFLRRLLVNCAQYILGPFGKQSDLRRQGLAMLERQGPLGRKRVVIATARKLAVQMLSLLKSGADWQAVRVPCPPAAATAAAAAAAEAAPASAAA